MKCTRPECDPPGDIEEGYCNRCGARRAGRRERTVPSTCRPPRRGRRGRAARGRGTRAADDARRRDRNRPRRRPTGRGPAAGHPRRGRRGADEPEHRREQAVLRQPRLQPAGRPRSRRRARTDRGLLLQVPSPVLVLAQARRGHRRRRPVRGARGASPTVASAGSTWRATSASTSRWVVLKGLLNTGNIDVIRAELRFLAQVDHPNIVRVYNFAEHDGEPVHRHGVRPRVDAAGDARRAEGREQRRSRPASPPATRSRSCSRCCPRSGTCTDQGLLVLRLQARQRDPHGRLAEADRPGRGVPHGRHHQRHLRHARASRRPRSPTPARRSPPTSTPSGARWPRCARRRVASTAPTRKIAPTGRRRAAVPGVRLAVPLPRAGDRRRSRRPVPVGRRDGGATRWRAARDRGRRVREAVARGQRAVHRRAARRGGRRRTTGAALPAPLVAADDPAVGLPRRDRGRRHRTRGGPRAPRAGSRADGRGAAARGARARSRPSGSPTPTR